MFSLVIYIFQIYFLTKTFNFIYIYIFFLYCVVCFFALLSLCSSFRLSRSFFLIYSSPFSSYFLLSFTRPSLFLSSLIFLLFPNTFYFPSPFCFKLVLSPSFLFLPHSPLSFPLDLHRLLATLLGRIPLLQLMDGRCNTRSYVLSLC